jgi:hypothetical protein
VVLEKRQGNSYPAFVLVAAAYALGDHKQWRQSTCIALAVAFCEILPLRKPLGKLGD